jgi:hypothetical protein
MSSEPVMVYHSLNIADAQLVRSRLEAAGFLASVSHELSALSLDGYSLAAGGVRVIVPASQAEEARRFLDESIETPPPSE